MPRRRIILRLILLTVAAFGLLAAAKLRATPKYDRVRVGMTLDEAEAIFGGPLQVSGWPPSFVGSWEVDEGRIRVAATEDESRGLKVTKKDIVRRGPLERLAWLAGWRPRPAPATAPLPVSPLPPAPPASK